jgi:hypothetical protein
MRSTAKRDLVRRVANRLFMAISGRRFRAWSVVEHVGRTSGRSYRNPVSAYPLGDGFVIPILYGIESNWVRNVLATGQLTLRAKGRDYELERPSIIYRAQALVAFPTPLRTYLRFRGIDAFVWAHLVQR